MPVNGPAEDWLDAVEAALAEGEADLSTELGGQRERTSARLWRGQVLVDWEADEQAGGCVLRPSLLRRLVALNAHVRPGERAVEVLVSGRILSVLSRTHADLVSRLGGVERVEMRLVLRFEEGVYRGGEEVYSVIAGRRRQPVLRLTASLRRVSPRMSPEKR